MGIDDTSQSIVVLDQTAHLLIEAVYLSGIDYNIAERVQIVIVEFLDVSSAFDLRSRPDMTRTLQCHGSQLTVVLILGLLGKSQNHACQHRIILCLCLLWYQVKEYSQEEQYDGEVRAESIGHRHSMV